MSDESVSPGGSPARLFALQPLLRALGIASEARKLVLGALAVILLSLGLSLLDGSLAPARSASPLVEGFAELSVPQDLSPETVWDWALRPIEPYRRTIEPFFVLFDPASNAVTRTHALLSVLWTILVFGLVGVAIARIAVVQLATGEKTGFGAALRFAARRWVSSVAAPLAPFVMITMLVALLSLAGLVTAIPGGAAKIVVSLLLAIPLLLGGVVAVVLLGLAGCWPLMHLTVAAEGEDMFDALSRSYSYFNQRRGHFVVQTLVAWVLGTIGAAAFAIATKVAVTITFWGLSLGGGDGVGYQGPLIADVFRQFWLSGVQILAIGWSFSFFWSAYAAIYLGLRRDVDGVPWHEVYVPEHERDTFAPEPPPATSEDPEVVTGNA